MTIPNDIARQFLHDVMKYKREHPGVLEAETARRNQMKGVQDGTVLERTPGREPERT